MNISARLINSEGVQQVVVQTNNNQRELAVPAKTEGYGSAVNGGELLFLALATCYCNDIYREAAKRGIQVQKVDVEVEGEFGGEGEPARIVTYRARVFADAPEEEVREFLKDRVAKFKHPKTIEFVKDLPLTATMKIKKAELKKKYLSAHE